MNWNRREFIAAPAALMATDLLGAEAAVPWQRKIRRLGQTNMTEHDPAVLDVEQWADYWASLKIDAVMVSVTGILAFYQTKVPYHRKGKFLGNRDFFGAPSLGAGGSGASRRRSIFCDRTRENRSLGI